MNETLRSLREVIANRRTLKPDQYTGERIDDHLIEEILNAANWAPTHGYTEPWRFTVFTGEGLARLGDFLAKLDQADPNAEDFNAERYERMRSRPLKASHVIGVGMKKGDNPKVPEVEEICSVAMAVQNMWLISHALRLGAYWSTGAMAFKPEVRDYLGLGEEDRSLGFFYLGVPAREAAKGRRLTSINDKLRWER